MNRRAILVILACLASGWFAVPAAPAQSLTPPAAGDSASRSLADRSFAWPAWNQWQRVLTLEDYNSRVVIFSTAVLGCAAGAVGSFTLLRKRALMGDALSHATLPGIGLAFLVATWLGGNGKSLPVLLSGATLSGLVGVAAIVAIRKLTRLKEDTALGIVLSVFFGAGVALLSIVQQGGHAAGLEAFIYGKTASMGVQDARLIAAAALVCLVVCMVLFKELKLLCFDEVFAGSRGVPVLGLDLILMGLVVIVCIVGLQAVGLILMIALLVIPAAAARFWTERMGRMTLISAVLGTASGMLGAAVSALFSKLPSGAMIVLICTLFFLASLCFGTSRGLLVRWLHRSQLNRTVDRQHLLRAMYEILETSERAGIPEQERISLVPREALLRQRSWSSAKLHREIRRAERAGLIAGHGDRVGFTQRGLMDAVRLTRQHRLWELYLVTYADIAPALVDRGADAIEHVLDPGVVAELEGLLETSDSVVPASPHQLDVSTIKEVADP